MWYLHLVHEFSSDVVARCPCEKVACSGMQALGRGALAADDPPDVSIAGGVEGPLESRKVGPAKDISERDIRSVSHALRARGFCS